MGWTSYNANYYKNGTIDRKRECDAYFLEGLNRGHYEVLKSTMIGKTYYAAIKTLKKYVGEKDGKLIYEDLPIEEQEVWAAVFLTATNMRDWYNFSYKPMDETVGPYEIDCPKSILDLLSPTTSEYALTWRENCYNKIEERKNKNSLENLPIGSVIEFNKPEYINNSDIPDVVRLTKIKPYYRKQCYWFDGYYRWRKGLIPKEFTIIKKGNDDEV